VYQKWLAHHADEGTPEEKLTRKLFIGYLEREKPDKHSKNGDSKPKKEKAKAKATEAKPAQPKVEASEPDNEFDEETAEEIDKVLENLPPFDPANYGKNPAKAMGKDVMDWLQKHAPDGVNIGNYLDFDDMLENLALYNEVSVYVPNNVHCVVNFDRRYPDRDLRPIAGINWIIPGDMPRLKGAPKA
jgi:hypothetical protein